MRRPPSGNWPTTRLDWIAAQSRLRKQTGRHRLSFLKAASVSTRKFIFDAPSLNTTRCNTRQNIFTVKLCRRNVPVDGYTIRRGTYRKSQLEELFDFSKANQFYNFLFSPPFRTTNTFVRRRTWRSFFPGRFHFDFRP